MANPGIKAAYDSFSSFNALLEKFEAQTVKTVDRITAMNAGFITLGNAFNTQKLPESMKMLADSLKSFNLAGGKLKDLSTVTSTLSSFLVKMNNLSKKEFDINTTLEKVSIFFDNLATINSKISKFKFDSMPLKNFFEFITSLSTLKINQTAIDNNLAGITTFLTKLSGTGNTITAAQKTTDALGHFKKSAKTLNLATGFKEIGAGFQSLFASNAKSGIFDAFKNIDINLLRNLTLAQQAISGFVSMLSTLSNINLDINSVEKSIASIDLMTNAFAGKNTFQKLGAAVSGISTSFSLVGTEIGQATGKMPKIKAFFSGLSGVGSSIAKGLGGFLAPSGFIERFSKFSTGQASTFGAFTKGITDLIDTLKKVSALKTIDIADVQHMGKTLDAFVKSFTGITGVERAGSIAKNLFSKNFGGVFKDLAGMFSPSIIKRISSFGGGDIQAFSRFSSAVIHIANAVQTLSSFTGINPAVVETNMKAVKNLISTFTGSGLASLINPKGGLGSILRFFGAGGLLNRFTNGDSVKSLSMFAKALFDFTTSMKIITHIDVDMNRMYKFITAIKKIVNELSRIRVGRNASALKTISGFFAEITAAASNVNLSNIKDTTFVDAGKRTARGYIKGFKKEMQIASPSKVMIALGKNIVEGLAIGITKSVGLVITGAKFLGGKLLGAFKQAFTVSKSIFNRFFNKVGDDLQSASRGFEQRRNGILKRAFNFGKALTLGSFGFNQITQAFSRIGNIGAASIDFEASMTDVFKTVDLDDLSEEQAQLFMEGFGNTISELATSNTSAVSGLSDSFSQLFGIAIQAGSAGIKRENLDEFVNTIGQLVIASDLTAEAGTSELASFATVTGTEEYSRLGSTIVELGNKYNATESKIVSFGQRLAGLKTGTNLTEADILALGAAMGSVGLESEAGGTAMTQFVNSIVSAISEGGDKLETFADVAGVSSGRFVKVWGEDPVKAIRKLIEGFGEMSAEEQLRIFDDLGTEGIRLTDMVRRLAGAEGLLGDAVETANTAWEENTALTEEAKKQSLTTRASLNRMNNIFKLLRKTIFDLFLDSFQGFIDSINEMTLKVIDFINVNKEVIKNIIPQLIKFFGIFGAGVLATSLNFGSLVTVVKTIISPLFSFFRIISAIAGFLFNPIGLIAGFLAIKFVPDLIKDLGDETSETRIAFSGLFESVGNFFSKVFELVGVVGQLITGFMGIKSEGESALTGISTLLSPIADFFRAIAEKIQIFIDNLRILGEAVGLDLGLGFNTTNEQQINDLLSEREAIIQRLAGQAPGGTSTIPATEAYKIASGDTLNAIASRFGVGVQDILAANPYIENPSLIFAGKELQIPISMVDADGNPITAPSDIFEENPELRRYSNDRLAEIDATVRNLEELDLDTKNDTFFDRIEKLSDTDIFKQIFGDDAGALSRAKEQISILETSMGNIQTAGTHFSDSISALFSGNFSGAIVELKNAGIEFATGISTGLSALFGNTNPANNPTVQAALAMGISDTGFGEGLSNAGSFQTNPIFDKVTGFIKEIGDALSFLDTMDLSGLNTLFTGIFDAVKSFAAPILEKAGSTITEIIIPAIENIIGMFTGDGALGSADLTNISTTANTLGDIFGKIVSFLGTVASVAGTLAAGTIKLIVDLFGGIGGLINNLQSGNTDVFANLSEFLFTPLIDFARNISIGTLDAVSNFLENLTGVELPSGEELFGDLINFFEDMIRRFKIGILDLRIEFDRVRGNTVGVEAGTELRALYGLGDNLTADIQKSIDSGVPVSLDNVIEFTLNGETFTGTIAEIIGGKFGDLSSTLTTSQSGTLQDSMQGLFNQFLTTGDATAFKATLDIYEMLGKPKLDFDITQVDWATLDTATIADGLIGGIFNFDQITSSDVSGLTGTSDKINRLVTDVFTNALGDIKLGKTGVERTEAANSLLYNLIDSNATLSDMQKSLLKSKVDQEFSRFFTAINPLDESGNPIGTSLGTDIVDGVVNGVSTSAPSFSTSMSDLGGGGLGAFASAMDIQSPSGKMIQMGKDIVSGLILGITGEEQKSSLATAININLIAPFEKFNLTVQIVIASIDSLIKKLLELGTTDGAGAVLPKLQGGLKYGGAVAAGKIYEVLEDKLPFEIFKTDTGRNYFLPNENGYMMSPANSKDVSVSSGMNAASGYVDNSTNINVPIVFESVPADMSEMQINKLSKTIGQRVKSEIELASRRKPVSQKLERRGKA